MYYTFNIISLILILLVIENVNGFLWDFFFPLPQSYFYSHDSLEKSNFKSYKKKCDRKIRHKPFRRRHFKNSQSDESNSVQYIIVHHKPKTIDDSYYEDDDNDSRGSSHHLNALVQKRHKDDYLHKRHRKCKGKSSVHKLLTLLFGSLQKTKHSVQLEKSGNDKDMYIHLHSLENKPKRKKWPKIRRRPEIIFFEDLFPYLKGENGRSERKKEKSIKKRDSSSRKVYWVNNNQGGPNKRGKGKSLIVTIKNDLKKTKGSRSSKWQESDSSSHERNNRNQKSKRTKKNQKTKKFKKESRSKKSVGSYSRFLEDDSASYY
uniref:Uncharacterized protein n=1 Tax=Strongyloides stercoralis TaxID=6248 RepID=A0A0K0EEY7_STRER